MAIFSTNQNRHFYVVKTVKATSAAVTAEGDICVKVTDPANTGDFNKEIHLTYMGKGGVTRTDRIQVKNFDYLKLIEAADMQQKLKKVKITLDANHLVDGKPIVGQDYVLRINFRQFYGMSDQDQYFKDAAVHVTKGMTTAQFYTKMVEALNLAFSREVGATKNVNPYLSFDATGGIIIEEKEQDWHLGIGRLQRVYFDIFPTTIYDGSDDVIWAAQDAAGNYYEDLTASNTNVIKNGKMIADLEWFCMGERGDQYRMKGWPDYVPTEYMITDTTKEYDVLELHHAFTDTGVNSYRSEKDITFVAEAGGEALSSLEEALKTAVVGETATTDDEG